jgi:two-component system cell cycle sensor histidine kinase/response regulator CckA
VAEDEVLIRLDLAESLRERGYKVLEAANAGEALTLLRAADVLVDLLLTDLVMPGGVDGFTLLRVAREEFPDVKLIVVSALISDERDQRVIADAVFPKPIRFNRLLDKIEDLLSKEP